MKEMNVEKTYLANVEYSTPLHSPEKVRMEHPVPEETIRFIINSRRELTNILDGTDKRLLIIVGPCSVHDLDAALEYADKLQLLAHQVKSELFLIMRAYVAKPRTTTGWKGIIYDPELNGRGSINNGIYISRHLLLELGKRKVPAATEMLDSITPRYITDLITWAAIGARNVESQPNRELASALAMPVGFKNPVSGDIDSALNAMESASNRHVFLGIDERGQAAEIGGRGNSWGHLVLRGGALSPNYTPKKVQRAIAKLQSRNLTANVIIDCSHANSRKQPDKQVQVFESVLKQRMRGNKHIVGLMLESNLHAGNQKIPDSYTSLAQLKYGVSITDPCISWKATEQLLLRTFNQLKRKRQ